MSFSWDRLYLFSDVQMVGRFRHRSVWIHTGQLDNIQPAYSVIRSEVVLVRPCVPALSFFRRLMRGQVKTLRLLLSNFRHAWNLAINGGEAVRFRITATVHILRHLFDGVRG